MGLFSAGIGRFFSTLGVPIQYGTMLGLLALSTFLLTTLDTCTRLARYVLQEFFGWNNAEGRVRWTATILTLILPAIMAFMTYTTPSGQVDSGMAGHLAGVRGHESTPGRPGPPGCDGMAEDGPEEPGSSPGSPWCSWSE